MEKMNARPARVGGRIGRASKARSGKRKGVQNCYTPYLKKRVIS
jgi:hypothetical protein